MVDIELLELKQKNSEYLKSLNYARKKVKNAMELLKSSNVILANNELLSVKLDIDHILNIKS